jgi:hypothetical protein
MKYRLIFWITFVAIINVKAQVAKNFGDIINEVSYGVPSSPAFELLPDKPSEITSLVTPHDIATNVSNVIVNGRLKTGFAFDIRPLAYQVGSLELYQKPKSWLKRIIWRTVLSIGSAPKNDEGHDVFLAAGIRVPIIDGSDPRADVAYLANLESAYVAALNRNQALNLNKDLLIEAQLRADNLDNDSLVKSVRETFLTNSWNKPKWDIGIAASTRAADGDFGKGSLFKDRIGLWTSAGIGLNKYAQITISAKSAWISVQSDTLESKRNVVGARTRLLMGENFAFSGEYAKVFSRYRSPKLNENWNHVAIVLEIKLPLVGGWLTLGYGGDSARRTNLNSKFVFSYAISTDQILKKKSYLPR